MTLEKVQRITGRICFDAEDCSSCPLGIIVNDDAICAYDRVHDVVLAEVKKEIGFCKIVLPDGTTLTIKEEDMDTIVKEIHNYKRMREKQE